MPGAEDPSAAPWHLPAHSALECKPVSPGGTPVCADGPKEPLPLGKGGVERDRNRKTGLSGAETTWEEWREAAREQLSTCYKCLLEIRKQGRGIPRLIDSKSMNLKSWGEITEKRYKNTRKQLNASSWDSTRSI